MSKFPDAQTALWFSLAENASLEELPRGVKRDLLAGFEELVTSAGREPFRWSGPTGEEVSVPPGEVIRTEYEMDHQKVGVLLKIRPERVRELLRQEAQHLVDEEARGWRARLALGLGRLLGRDTGAMLARRREEFQDGLTVVLQAGLIMEMSRRVNVLLSTPGSGMSPTLNKALEDLGRVMEEQGDDVAHGPERLGEDGTTLS